MMNRQGLALGAAFIFVSAVALAVGQMYNVKSVTYDKTSGKVQVAYSNTLSDDLVEVRVTDSGPILLCVLNRLLQQKYRDREIKKMDGDDITLVAAAAGALPEDERKVLRDAAAGHLFGGTRPEEVLSALTQTIRTSLKDHVTEFEEDKTIPSPLLADLQERRVTLMKKAGALAGSTDPDETALVARYQRELARIDGEIKETKPVSKTEKGKEGPVNWGICVKGEGSKSQSGIVNKPESVAALLKATGKVLGELTASGTKLLKKSKADH